MLRVTIAVLALVAVAGVSAAAVYFVGREDEESTPRQREVAARGAEVMPFELEETTHHFTPLPDGGVVRVLADDPSDRRQVLLVRRHLAREADAFAVGDYSDPMRIHGSEMPGVEVLRERHESVDVRYRLVRAGAEIELRSDDVDVVAALHEWLDAQTSDHGSHAARG